MRKYFIILAILLLIMGSMCSPISYVKADDETDIEQEFTEQLNESVNEFDFGELDRILDGFGIQGESIFGDTSFQDKLNSIINGDFSEGYGDIISAILGLLLDDVLAFIPLLCSMVAIVILCSFINQLRSNLGSKSVSDVVHFVCYGIIIVIISSCVTEVIGITTTALSSMKSQMEIIFPIILTLMTAVGGVVSVSVFQPAVVVLTSGIMEIFSAIIMPLFIITFIFIIVQNLSNTIKFDKFTSFFSSAFKWILGSVFTIFFAFISIQGLVANTYDSISIRTAKFTMRSYIPFVGGYLSDGFDLILSSSVLIKNAVGATGLFLMIATVLVPIIKLVILIFGFKLVAAILEPIADNRISSFIFSVSKSLNMLVACLLGVAFMYFLTIGLLMCTCNIF